MKFAARHTNTRIFQKVKVQNALQNLGRFRSNSATLTIQQETISRPRYGSQHEHVTKVHIFNGQWCFSIATEPAFKFCFWVAIHRLCVGKLFSGLNLFDNASHYLGTHHCMQARHGLIKIRFPGVRIVLIIHHFIIVKSNPIMNEAPHLRPVVTRETLWKLKRVIVVIRWHIPSRPPVQLKIMLVIVHFFQPERNFFFVHRIDFTCFAIAFKEFLGHVLAAGQHINAVQPKVGFVTQFIQHFPEFFILCHDSIHARKELCIRG
mmetsp:Transcript_22742/g.41112  ORF Transcript_22742/g.41112 Transcript_22742/m.41112 type:complete len:263 (+) Transcript_22742:368-1156(+)